MRLEEALIAYREKIPVIAKWPFTDNIEYECILKINDNNSVALKDKCGHSVTIANLKNLRLKPIKGK